MARPTAAAMAVRLGPPSMPTPAAWLMTARSYSERGSLRRRSFSEAPDPLTRPAPSPFGGHTLVAGGGALWSPKLDQVLDREAGIAEDPDPLPVAAPVFDRVVAHLVQLEVALDQALGYDVCHRVPAHLDQWAQAAKGEQAARAQEPSRLRNRQFGFRERHHAVIAEDDVKAGVG